MICEDNGGHSLFVGGENPLIFRENKVFYFKIALNR